jgi:hypothetical protein
MSVPDHQQVPRADVLYVTHCRAAYTRKSLPGLLKAVEGRGRVWIWHNSDHEEKDPARLRKIEEAWQVVQEFKDHPSIAHIHHSKKNVRLIPAMRWIFSKSRAEFIAKVDDDAIVEEAWLRRMIEVHDYFPQAGILGAWTFMPEDYDEELAAHKIIDIGNNLRILRNNWVSGSAFVMKGKVVRGLGGLRWRESFTALCCRAARRDWIVGWPLPLIYEDHMDDPRSPNAGYEKQGVRPLSAISNSTSPEQWQSQLEASAKLVQACDLRLFPGETGKLFRIQKWTHCLLGAPVRRFLGIS